MSNENCSECGRPISITRHVPWRYHAIALCPKCYKKASKKATAEQKSLKKIFKNCTSCDGKGSIKGYTCQSCDGRGKYESVEIDLKDRYISQTRYIIEGFPL